MRQNDGLAEACAGLAVCSLIVSARLSKTSCRLNERRLPVMKGRVRARLLDSALSVCGPSGRGLRATLACRHAVVE
jgi:hypothetical protein